MKLTPEYTIGKEIGGGVQGRVLALLRPDGEKTNKLLKVSTLLCLYTRLLLFIDYIRAVSASNCYACLHIVIAN